MQNVPINAYDIYLKYMCIYNISQIYTYAQACFLSVCACLLIFLVLYFD